MSAATVSNVRPDKNSQKRALSGRIGRVQVGAGSDQDGDGLGIALAGRKEPRRVSLVIPLFDVGFCLYRRRTPPSGCGPS